MSQPRPTRLATVALLVGLLALALAPAAAAEQRTTEREFHFTDDRAADTRTVVVLTGDTARSARDFADRNRDGEVNFSEREGFRAFMHGIIEQDPHNTTRLAGEYPTNHTVDRVQVEGVQGATARTDPITITSEGTLVYPAPGDDAVLPWRLEVADGDAGGSLTLTAPPGRTVAAHEGLQNAEVGDGNRTLTGEVAGDGDVVVQLAEPGAEVPEAAEGGNDAPIPATLALAALCLAAGALARRR